MILKELETPIPEREKEKKSVVNHLKGNLHITKL